MLEFLVTIGDWCDFTLFYVFAASFLARYHPKRKYFVLKVSTFIVFLIGVIVLWRFFNIEGNSSNTFVKRLEYWIPYFVIMIGVKCCFKCSFNGALFCASVGYAIQHFIEKYFLFIFFTFEIECPFPLQFLLSICMMGIIYSTIWFIFIRKQKHAFEEIKVDYMQQFLLSVSIILLDIYFDFNAMNLFGESPTEMIIPVFILTSSMVADFIVVLLEFSILQRKQLVINNEYLKDQLDELKKLYEKDKHDIELVNIRCHDIRHQIRAMKLDEAAENELTSAIDVYDSRIKTGNVALDVVLAKFNLHCTKNNIKFTCMLDGTKLNFIPEHEIYALFGNAIENAIHAVSSLEEEKRIISITQSCNGELTNVSITNFFKGELEWKDGLPLSRQKNHGFGMRSMRHLIENYGGRMHVLTKDDLFVLNIFLPNTED